MKTWIQTFAAMLAVLACGRTDVKAEMNPPIQEVVETRGKSPEDAVRKMMAFLPDIANEDVYERLGFRSLDEVKRAKPGKPIARIWLGCDSIKAYRTSKGEGLERLAFLRHWLFPLEVDKQARSTMVAEFTADTVEGGKLDWKVVEVGGANWAAILDTVLRPHSEKNGIDPGRYSLVVIPALNQAFVAYPDMEGSWLLPVKGAGSPCWPVADGKPKPMRASSMLHKLSQCNQLDAACTEPPPWRNPNKVKYEYPTGEADSEND